MKFDLLGMDFKGLENKKQNVFYQNDLFKTRVIKLKSGGEIPSCDMKDYVIFNVIKGEVTIFKNDDKYELQAGDTFIAEPAIIGMKTDTGVRLMGIQIVDRK